jgi:hypothetical protein
LSIYKTYGSVLLVYCSMYRSHSVYCIFAFSEIHIVISVTTCVTYYMNFDAKAFFVCVCGGGDTTGKWLTFELQLWPFVQWDCNRQSLIFHNCLTNLLWFLSSSLFSWQSLKCKRVGCAKTAPSYCMAVKLFHLWPVVCPSISQVMSHL